MAVAKDIAALAALVQEQQRFDDAKRLYRRALGIFEKAFGPVHYELAVTYNNLAAVLSEVVIRVRERCSTGGQLTSKPNYWAPATPMWQ